MNQQTKGYIYMFMSSLLVSMAFIFTKHFLQFTNPFMLSFLFFIMAFFIAFVWTLLRSQVKFLPVAKRYWRSGLTVGIVNTFGALFWFNSIAVIGPSLTAFFLRFSTIFAILFGVMLLREKLSFIEVIGAFIAVGGALLISISNGKFIIVGLLLALGTSFTFAFQQFLSKIYLKNIDYLLLIDFRLFFSMIFIGLATVSLGKLSSFPLSQLPLLMIAAFLTAIAAWTFFYKGLMLMDISKSAVIRTLDPFVVVIYAFLIFDQVPTFLQMIGGTLIVAGVMISVLTHRIKGMLRFRWSPW